MGYPHPDYLLKYLTSRQITEWFAYYKIEPFGPHAEEMRFGIIGALLVNFFTRKPNKVADPRNYTLSLAPKVRTTPEVGLVDKLVTFFGKNAIPKSEWKKMKKNKKKKRSNKRK